MPIVGDVESGARRTSPRSRSSASRPRAAASRPPGACCCGPASSSGLSLENGLHELVGDDAELASARRRGTASSCATSAGRPPGLDCPTGANLEVDAHIVLTVGSDCAIGKMTVSLELDRAARARGPRLGVRADGSDGHRDRGVGDRRRRGRLRLPRRRRGAARRRGTGAAAASSSSSRARGRSCIRPTRA